MGYELHGLVGRLEPIAHAAAELRAVAVRLAQGYALLPGPEPEGGDPLPAEDQPLWWLSLDLEWAAVAASRVGPIAYLEAEFFGGTGSQAAIVWDDGLIVLGPVHRDGPRPVRRQAGTQWPINLALRRLGVEPRRVDEFDALGLGRHPDTDRWREVAASAW